MKLFILLAAASSCFGLSVNFKNTSDCDLTVSLYDAAGCQLGVEKVEVDHKARMDVDTFKHVGPYSVEWTRPGHESKNILYCFGARKLDYLEDEYLFESQTMDGQGCCEWSIGASTLDPGVPASGCSGQEIGNCPASPGPIERVYPDQD
jgi:hypothetical protein